MSKRVKIKSIKYVGPAKLPRAKTLVDIKQDHDIKQLKKQNKSEMFTYTFNLPLQSYTVLTMGFDKMVYPMIQGDNNGQRKGNKIQVYAIHFDCTVLVKPVPDSDQVGQYARLIMYYNKAWDQTDNITAPGRILENNGTSAPNWNQLNSTRDIDAFDNSVDNTKNNFRCLFDKKFVFGYNANQTDLYSFTDGSKFQWQYHKKFKNPLEIVWGNTIGATYKQLMLNIICGPNNSFVTNPDVTYNWTVFYKDA